MVNSELVNDGKSNKVFRKTRKKFPKWTKRVVKVRRITKVIKGGKKLRFGAVVVIGNANGQVGLGVGKACIQWSFNQRNYHTLRNLTLVL